MPRTGLRSALGITAMLASAGLITACGSGAADVAPAAGAESGGVQAEKVDAIASEVPQQYRDAGQLVFGQGTGQSQYRPIAFSTVDDPTLVGLLPDVEDLIAGSLGLDKVDKKDSFEGAFLGLDSGKYDILVSQIDINKDREEKYDMSSFAMNKYAFLTDKSADLTVDGPEDLAGKTVAIKPGTAQAGLLDQWNAEVTGKGLEPIDIKGYGETSSSYLALKSGKVDAYLTIGAVADYRAAQDDSDVRVAGYFPLPKEDSLIGIVTKKGSGLAQPVCDAINHAIDSGQYQEILERWHLGDYGVERCEVNPPTGH